MVYLDSILTPLAKTDLEEPFSAMSNPVQQPGQVTRALYLTAYITLFYCFPIVQYMASQ